MSCPLGYTGYNSFVIIDGVEYPNETFTPPSRTRNNVSGMNNGDDFECKIPTHISQEELKVTSYLIDTDFAALEALFQSKEIVSVETGTQIDVDVSNIPVYHLESYNGYVSGVTHGSVANTELVKCDWMVMPTSNVTVTSGPEPA